MYKVRLFYGFTPLNGSKSLCKREYRDYVFKNVVSLFTWLVQYIGFCLDKPDLTSILWNKLVLYKNGKRFLVMNFYDYD